MATRMLRRGLPRVTGGEPWPPAGDVELENVGTPDVPQRVVERAEGETKRVERPQVAETATSVAATEPGFDAHSLAQPVSSSAAPQPPLNDPQEKPVRGATLRRGLPRTPGGEPWPPAGAAAVAVDPSTGSGIDSVPQEAAPRVAPRGSEATETKRVERAERVEASTPEEGFDSLTVAQPVSSLRLADARSIQAAQPSAAPLNDPQGTALRRGLPRTPGGEPWPPAGTTAVAAVVAVETEEAPADFIEASDIPASVPVATIDVSTPLPFPQTVFPGKDAFTHAARAPEPARIGPFTKGQWAGAVIVGGIALLGAAAMAVFLVRWLLSFGALQDFVATFPGEYHLPEGAPVGFPGWLGWQHFLNVFLMVLIIRSGLRIRNEKRPTAFWTPRGDPKGKVSLTIWFHQALDILWLLNGVVFIILLFVSGQWMRVIPTSWEVFPNAISAVLQYISLDWPTENGWVNYNSIQQITYFITIFIAAPLAAVTGFRMSGMWPKKAEKLSKAYPIEWARALHFPVMLYFVVFIAIHVFLVFATGALRNLNHMYAAQGSTDPAAYADNWTGFWFFVASLAVIAAAWVAARPLVLAPIAKLFGTVSAR